MLQMTCEVYQQTVGAM